MTPTRLFLDTEFTGLHQATTLISLGIVSASGAAFYAEFVDYDAGQLDAWLRDNVIARTHWLRDGGCAAPFDRCVDARREVLGDRTAVAEALRDWLGQFETIEFWGDCLAYDWVLFAELFGGSQHLPAGVSYMPGDLVTLLRLNGYDPDVSRLALAGIEPADGVVHNALFDAKVLRLCFDVLKRQGGKLL